MTQNNGSKYAPGYDLFKLIVAILLTILLVVLLLRESRQRYAGLGLNGTASAATEQAVLPTMTSPPLQASTSTPLPLPTPTVQSTAVQPTLAEPTATALIPAGTPSPTGTTAALDLNDCPTKHPHVQMGDKVVIKNWLHFRTGPGLYFKIQRTNRPGTELEVIGGPVCTIRIRGDNPRAYIWWQVRMQDGREGWSVEAPLNDPEYLLEPVR